MNIIIDHLKPEYYDLSAKAGRCDHIKPVRLQFVYLA